MNRVKELRVKAQMQQKDLAIAMGVAQPTISEWENQRKDPSREKVRKLCEVFNCTPTEVVIPDDYFDPHKYAVNAPSYSVPSDIAYYQERLRRYPEMQNLLEAADTSTPEQIQAAADMLKNPSATDTGTPRTLEARIVSFGMDNLPKEERERILSILRIMYMNNPDLFRRSDEDDA